jgi:ferredoxin-NADP reductase
MSYQFYDAKIIDIIDETDSVKRFFVKMPDEMNFSFKAGQFIMFNLPIQSKYTNRSYSIASAPSADGVFEVCIVLKPDGLGTTYKWSNFTVGTEVKVSKALGKFNLKEPIEHDLCFIGTGTGIAPLRSQILDIYNRGIAHKNIYLIFGNRWEKDILYRKEFEELEKKMPGFHFIPVLSRENPGWEGRKGYVHAVYEEIFADKRPATFYICGWSDMLKDARVRLTEMGYQKDAIRFESYD